MQGEGDGVGGWGRGIREGDGVVSICKIGTFLVILRTFLFVCVLHGYCAKMAFRRGKGEGGCCLHLYVY